MVKGSWLRVQAAKNRVLKLGYTYQGVDQRPNDTEKYDHFISPDGKTSAYVVPQDELWMVLFEPVQ